MPDINNNEDYDLNEDIREYLRTRLQPNPDDDLSAERDYAQSQGIANAVQKAGIDYLNNVSGTNLTPYQGTSAEEELKRRFKQQDDAVKLKDALAKGLLTAENKPSSTRAFDLGEKVIDGKFKGVPVKVDSQGTRFFLYKGKPYYETSDDPEVQDAFTKTLGFGKEITPIRGGYKEADIAQRQQSYGEFSEKERDAVKSGRGVLNSLAKIRDFKRDADTGWFRHYWEMGKSIFEVEDPKFSLLQNQTAKLLAEYTKFISGAQVSEEERQRLETVVPTTKMGDRKFLDSLDNFEDNIKKEVASIIETKLMEGKDASRLIAYFSEAGYYNPSMVAQKSGILENVTPTSGELQPVIRAGIGLEDQGKPNLKKAPKEKMYDVQGKQIPESVLIGRIEQLEARLKSGKSENPEQLQKALDYFRSIRGK